MEIRERRESTEGRLTTTEYDKCGQCGEEVTPDSDFCPHCGALFAGSSDELCETHSGRMATGVCVICRKLVCDECGVLVRGRMHCVEHEGVEIQEDWATIFQSTDPIQCELVKTFLDGIGCKVLVQEYTPFGVAWGDGAEFFNFVKTLGYRTKVFVPIPEFLRAQSELKQWESAKADDSELAT